MVVGVLMSAASWACEPREPLIARLDAAVAEARWPEAELTLEVLLHAFGCGSPAEPELLARMWQAESAIATQRGDPGASEDAKLAAQRMRGETMPEELPGKLFVEPLGVAVALDGQLLAELPAQTAPGLHLVQGGAVAEQMQAAQLIFVAPGTELTVQLPIQPLPPPLPPPRKLAGHQRGLIVLGITTGIGGLALAGVALQQNSVMHEADTHDAVDAAFRMQRFAGVTSYGLLGASATSIVLASVWR